MSSSPSGGRSSRSSTTPTCVANAPTRSSVCAAWRSFSPHSEPRVGTTHSSSPSSRTTSWPTSRPGVLSPMCLRRSTSSRLPASASPSSRTVTRSAAPEAPANGTARPLRPDPDADRGGSAEARRDRVRQRLRDARGRSRRDCVRRRQPRSRRGRCGGGWSAGHLARPLRGRCNSPPAVTRITSLSALAARCADASNAAFRCATPCATRAAGPTRSRRSRTPCCRRGRAAGDLADDVLGHVGGDSGARFGQAIQSERSGKTACPRPVDLCLDGGAVSVTKSTTTWASCGISPECRARRQRRDQLARVPLDRRRRRRRRPPRFRASSAAACPSIRRLPWAVAWRACVTVRLHPGERQRNHSRRSGRGTAARIVLRSLGRRHRSSLHSTRFDSPHRDLMFRFDQAPRLRHRPRLCCRSQFRNLQEIRTPSAGKCHLRVRLTLIAVSDNNRDQIAPKGTTRQPKGGFRWSSTTSSVTTSPRLKQRNAESSSRIGVPS